MMTTETTQIKGRVYCGQCGGELKLYTTAEGTPAPSHRDGCWRAYCEGCGATGPLRAATVEGRIDLGERAPKARLTLNTTYDTPRGVVDQRRTPRAGGVR